ncbi:m7GpppX diphosphatase-like isoform X2 [Mya arenaria]|uniref:m7GpppX diphosphatase-like isoform X2 n=1 Tax=Mya arenaria TaxID=6604 RepID=UPI0022E5EB0A|nr:m7GpppX diphosphatase-like isoform X2 [Mya arenaria]
MDRKKRKLESGDRQDDDRLRILDSFEGFKVKSVISENSRCKTAVIHGELDGKDAIVLLERKPFNLSNVSNYFTEETGLENTLKNDIYGTYDAYPPKVENAVKAVVIHPATEKHVQKYTDQERYIVHETPSLYEQWVYNILEKKKEADRIVYEDTDPDTGFILLPDMKWDRTDTSALYLVAIVHKHNIKSLRDLDTGSLPLLQNILKKGLKAIQDTYDIPASKLNVYIHYQPSYYHFHVHFTNVKFEAPGFGADRAHLLADVINNIQLYGDFYKKKTLTFLVREQEDLYMKFKDAGYFDCSEEVSVEK